MNKSQLKAIILESLKDLSEKNKLPRGRPPKKLANAFNVINNMTNIADEDEEASDTQEPDVNQKDDVQGVAGKNKLPRGRPPKKLANALKAINAMTNIAGDDDSVSMGNDNIEEPVVAKHDFKQAILNDPEDKRLGFQKPLTPDYKVGKFDIEEFMNLKTPKERMAYANDKSEYGKANFNKIGVGSSRAAFIMPGTGKVLKVARNDKGIAQNKEELEITKRIHLLSPDYPIVTKIYGTDNAAEPTWLIAEAVNPNETAILNALGKYNLNENYFVTIIGRILDLPKERANQWLQNMHIHDLKNPEFVKLVNGLFALKDAKVLSGDAIRMDHWGVTEDGRLVILDYGFTRDVADKHYNRGNKHITKRFD